MSFLIGALISFFGSFNPSILTLTTLKISIQQGKKAGYWFALGIGVVIAIQAYISLEFASFIKENPFVERNIQIIGCAIFFLLSFYFFSLGKTKKKQKPAIETKTQHPFTQGVILALLNVFSIVFYAGTGLALNYAEWLEFNFFEILQFSIGSAVGSFAFLILVVKAATFIDSKMALLSNNINYILGIVTGFVALLTLYALI